MKEEIFDKFQRFYEIYSKEKDEKLVFLTTATIEDLLNRALKKRLLASRLGLISVGLAEELQLLRKIRREFKNKIDCTTLDYKEAQIFCVNLKAPAYLKTKSDHINRRFSNTPRGNFELTVTIISCMLDDILDNVKTISQTPMY